MSAQVYWRAFHTGTAEITSHFRTDTWKLSENAEEASQATSSITADDTDGSFGTLQMALNHIEVIDTACPGDIVLWAGHITDLTDSRGDTVNSTQFACNTIDRNVAWSRRVMVGSDCNRSAETDVARMQWLLATSEAAADFDDVTTYVSTASPVNMDAADYRGQPFQNIASDCAQASGKNYWAQEMGTAIWSAIQTFAWYDFTTSTAYTGTCVVTNDSTLIDEATYWPASQDSTLLRDYSRVYSGGYMPFDGGATYRENASTASAYGRRDFIAPSYNVKSLTKAQARMDRMLTSMADPHLRVGRVHADVEGRYALLDQAG